MRPAVLYVVTGGLWLVRSLASFGDPGFTDPETAFDWFAVLSFSAALAALALALLAFAQMVGGRWARITAAVGASGASVAAVANVVEDGLEQGWAGTALYLPGTLLMLLGLVTLTIATAVTSRGSARLLAAIPAAALLGMMLLELGGGVLVLAAWLAAALVATTRVETLEPEAAGQEPSA